MLLRDQHEVVLVQAEEKWQSSHKVICFAVLILGHACSDLGTEMAVVILV